MKCEFLIMGVQLLEHHTHKFLCMS